MNRETTFTRRTGLALGLCAVALPWLPAEAGPLQYPLHPVEIAPAVWTIYGAPEPITRGNGGAIANLTVLDTSDGAVLIDAGPSHRYGTALKALAERLTGKPVVRVYLTHIHADHVLGATAFEPGTVSGGLALRGDLKRAGTDLTNGMYRVAGDWMRGTGVPEPGRVAEAGVETIGERRFRILPLAATPARNLCLFEESSGLLFPGDLVFLDRAATTPDADPERWRGALTMLGEIDHRLLIPAMARSRPDAAESIRRGAGSTRLRHASATASPAGSMLPS